MLTLIKETRRLDTRWTPQYAPASPSEASGCVQIPRSRPLDGLMEEVDCLMRKRVPIGLAVIAGDIGPAACREIKDNLSRIADYLSWIDAGPVRIAAFQKSLFRDLLPVWCELLAGAPCVAGVAFSDRLENAEDLLLAARLALAKAQALGQPLVAFEHGEALQAVLAQDAENVAAPTHPGEWVPWALSPASN